MNTPNPGNKNPRPAAGISQGGGAKPESGILDAGSRSRNEKLTFRDHLRDHFFSAISVGSFVAGYGAALVAAVCVFGVIGGLGVLAYQSLLVGAGTAGASLGAVAVAAVATLGIFAVGAAATRVIHTIPRFVHSKIKKFRPITATLGAVAAVSIAAAGVGMYLSHDNKPNHSGLGSKSITQTFNKASAKADRAIGHDKKFVLKAKASIKHHQQS